MEHKLFLSDGSPSTLETYRKISELLFGEKAVEFIDKKISESPNGEKEVVLADETQMLLLLSQFRR